MKEVSLSSAAERLLAETPAISAPRSKRFVRATPARLSEWLGREATTADLTEENARAWLECRSHVVGRHAVRTDAKRLLTLWRWCASHGIAQATTATPTTLCPDGMRRYGVAGPPVRTDAPRRPKTGTKKPRGKAPPRPDQGVLARLLRL